MNNQELISIAEAALLFPKTNGNPPHLNTMRRRIRVGVRGVKLRAVFDGSGWRTTETWVHEFLDATTAAAMPDKQSHPEAIQEQVERNRQWFLRRYGSVKEKEAAMQASPGS